MVQIDPPILPSRFYRYRNVDSIELAEREISAISDNYLWCSRYKDLNDPMEGIYGASPTLAKNPTFERLAWKILNEKRSVGICCFSDTHDNELMWVHYAGNYAGICVAYSTNQLVAGLNDDVHVVRMAYDGSPPRLRDEDGQYAQRAAMKILSHKKSCWLYEREWRLLTSSPTIQVPGRLTIATAKPVKRVYFGSRIKPEVRAKLNTEFAKMDIPISTMELQAYDHIWKQ